LVDAVGANLPTLDKHSSLFSHLSDFEKLRLIYSWITHHIEYDVEKERQKNTPQAIENILETKETLCLGYAQLFEHFAAAHHASPVQVGKTRNCVKLQLDEAHHAWNTTAEGWLIDATWGAGYVSKRSHKFVVSSNLHIVTKKLLQLLVRLQSNVLSAFKEWRYVF
jgi:transglutaminase/protease-like cytokinesis protein 3